MMNQPPLILLVDDEADFLEIFYTKLRAAGFRVETAESGEKAIEAAKKLKPDLILMDMKMPKMNGAQVMMKLKEDPETKDIKVVFLTNFGDPRTEMEEIDRKFSRDLGAMDYLRKTSDLDEVVQKIQTFFK
ncbi:MAG: response regulator [Candidatus Liptonbacteria bacterium]|nr:response regulator [Candidatus Liptonbacteria bacterium]